MEDRKTLPLVVKRVKHQAPEPKKGLDPHCVAVGERLRKLRERARMTHKEVADAVGLERGAKRSVIGKWERGESWPRSDALRAICDLFRVSADWLLRDPGNETVALVSRSKIETMASEAAGDPESPHWQSLFLTRLRDDMVPIHGAQDLDKFKAAMRALRDRGDADDILNALAWVAGVDG